MKNLFPKHIFYGVVWVVLLLASTHGFAQIYYSNNSNSLYKTEITCTCGDCCEFETIGNTFGFGSGLTFSPNGDLFGFADYIFQIDPNTGNYSVYYIPTINTILLGIISTGNGIFYSMIDQNVESGNGCIEMNTNTGVITNLGSDPIYTCQGDLCLFNGEVYYPSYINFSSSNRAIVKFSLSNPTNVSVVINYSGNYVIRGLSATNFCNTLIGTDRFTNDLILINLIDGSMEPICSSPALYFWITSMQEFSSPTQCETSLDLDCDDSSGATDADFNSPEYNCLTDGVPITDEDIKMLYDAIVTSMTVRVVGNVPDDPQEILDMTGSVSEINVTGLGTDFITFTNAGSAKSTDFKDALRLVVYKNTAEPLTPGPRTVQVRFTTASGAMSNIATAFIDVIALPLTDVDLGPDLQACDGETVVFDAGHPGSDYTWSTGSHNQTITVGESGEYIVTVEDGINCPGHDTVELEILPVINVALTGDIETCDNEAANLLIETNTPFSLSIDIASDPGTPFHFPDVDDDFPFTDLPTQSTTYTITNVTSSQDACVVITDPVQVVNVYPTYIQSVDATICQGDSIWLGYYYETLSGVYENTFNTFLGATVWSSPR